MHVYLKNGIYFLIFFGCIISITAQVQPFSRKDSAMVLKYTENYNIALGKKRFKEAATNLNEIAFLFWDHNQYPKAINYYESSLKLNKKVGNENGIAMISNNLGMLHSDIKDYTKAIDYFNATLASRRANKETIGIISALINLSVVKNNLAKYDESIDALEEAVSLARQINDLDQMRSCYGMLAETYQKAGNNEKSLYYFEFYRSFHELSQQKIVSDIEGALQDEKQRKKVLENEHVQVSRQLQVKKGEISNLANQISMADATLSALNIELDAKNIQLKLVEKEKEILALKAEKEREKVLEESRKRKQAFLVSALIIGFLSIVTLLIFLNRRKIKAKNQQLSERNTYILAINRDLKEANRIKDTLFSVIGHDLKSPLAQLEQTFLMIDDGSLNKQEVELIFDELKQGLKQTNLLLENLLAWAKNQIYGDELRLRTFELNHVADESIYVLKNLYKSKDITLTKIYNYTGDIYADVDMVKLIIRNLTSNAIKFTPKFGQITVETATREHYALIRVADTGIGMTQEQVDNLFDTNTTNSTYGTEREKGTGIGLKLCKEFIDLMQGKIEIQSVVGEGTTFTILLPVKPSTQNT